MSFEDSLGKKGFQKRRNFAKKWSIKEEISVGIAGGQRLIKWKIEERKNIQRQIKKKTNFQRRRKMI